MNDWLGRSLPLEKEVHEALKSKKSEKAPRPDGFPIGFYQRYWTLMKLDIMTLICKFFYGRISLKMLHLLH